MRSTLWSMAAACFACAAGSAWALEGSGLVPSERPDWPRWQGRLSLATGAGLLRPDPMDADRSGQKLAGATVLGDWYFTRSLPRLGDAGGFRATSGMFLGTRAGSLLSATPGLGGRAFNVDRRSVGGLSLPGLADAPPDSGAVPYVGLGYTGLPGKDGGWGFSADLGVMALNPGAAVKLGRAFGGPQNLDDAVRDLRLTPLVQVGVSYSF